MGTSAPNGGPKGSNPLIPDWIDGDGLPPAGPPPEDNPPNDDDNNTGDKDTSDEGNDYGREDNEGNLPVLPAARPQIPPVPPQPVANRYREPRIQFNKYLRSGGQNTDALKSALRSYSRHAAGGTGRMARRMAPATNRVARFVSVLSDVSANGRNTALTRLNLGDYTDRPLIDVLSALTDVIFADSGLPYEDTQDDSIVKQAYANTVNRIASEGDIDLDNLNNEQIEVMTAIFIEETIAQRVINDLGDLFAKSIPNVAELIKIEEEIYQIISGLVRTQIMPEIIATQRGNRADLNRNIENVYRTAFDAMAGEND